MKSPHTGKHMPLHVSKADFQFRGEHFWIHWIYYECPDTKERLTDEILDTLNTYQMYRQYAEKHGMALEDVMPKETLTRYESFEDLKAVPVGGAPNYSAHREFEDFMEQLKANIKPGDTAAEQLRQDELELLSCPGDTIKETVGHRGINLVWLLLKMELDYEAADGLLDGKTPIDANIAQKLEQVLGIDAQFWLNRERLYRAKLAQLTKKNSI
jgi:plasmid maintenance system antidote protein VapI